MRYISTRGAAPALGFEDVVLTGLARDGGLYIPTAIPALSSDEILHLSGLSYSEIAFRILTKFLAEELSLKVLEEI